MPTIEQDNDISPRRDIETVTLRLFELVALAGYYHTISYVANALRLPLEPFGARFNGE